jgi:hypothetical protein
LDVISTSVLYRSLAAGPAAPWASRAPASAIVGPRVGIMEMRGMMEMGAAADLNIRQVRW